MERNGRFIKLLAPLSEFCPPFCNFLISKGFLKVNSKEPRSRAAGH